MPKLNSFRFKRPQQFAALLLAMLLAQCLWVGHRQTLTTQDYDFARCGREMWEKPSPLAGYFTSCGNIPDGTLGYRAAGLPLTIQRMVASQDAETSTWEMRHELRDVLFLLHSAFMLTGLLLGAALWWVARRLYGNTGGFIALAFYCFSPSIIRACTYPNNLPILGVAILGSLLLVFASYAFEADAFSYYFRGDAGRMWLSFETLRPWFLSLPNAAVTIAAVVALVLYVAARRSRYFGNTLPLLLTVLLFPLITPGAQSNPALWALPFLFGFIAGVFADILETRSRRIFLWITGSLLVLEATLCLLSLPSLTN
jgi:hypothetical protein